VLHLTETLKNVLSTELPQARPAKVRALSVQFSLLSVGSVTKAPLTEHVLFLTKCRFH
jgi:hypothetical protein